MQSVADRLSTAVQEVKQVCQESQTEQNRSLESVSVPFSKTQRKYLAGISSQLADRMRVTETGVQEIELPLGDLIELASTLEESKATATGSTKNAVTKSLRAIEQATMRHCESVTRTGRLYRIRIELQYSNPLIWRQIEVPDCTLYDLHLAVQDAMGWENDHAFAFTIDKRSYLGTPMGGGMGAFDKGEDAEEFLMSDVLSGRKKKFQYEYDFGDSWRHVLQIEKSWNGPLADGGRCLGGENNCPPEDCGGIYGFCELCELLADPEASAEDDERVEWFEDYDPTAFDADCVTRRLKRLFAIN